MIYLACEVTVKLNLGVLLETNSQFDQTLLEFFLRIKQ